MIDNVTSFRVLIFQLYIFFCKMFISFAHFFLYWMFVLLLLSLESLLHVQITNILSDMCFVNVSSQCVACLFIFLECLSKSRIFIFILQSLTY